MMELGLSLGASKPFTFMEKPSELQAPLSNNQKLDLGINTALSIGPISTSKSCDDDLRQEQEDEEHHQEQAKKKENHSTVKEDQASDYKLISSASLSSSSNKSNNNHNSLQLHLLPHSKPLPLSSFSWPPPSENCDEMAANPAMGLKVKTMPEEEESEERTVLSSSPMSGASSFQVDLCIYSNNSMSGSGNYHNNSNNSNRKRQINESEGEGNYYYDRRGCSSRASDEDDNHNDNNVGVRGGTRKKLRLSKEQSAFLEESFKEHSTLNPRQKLALAKQLNLRPRQVEVWFQNRRARTKLKQTEVDCEYLKRCCETLSEENRRLQKELQELRALKASNSNPFFMQLPATTLTMCPSCERVASNPSSSNNNNNSPSASASASSSKPVAFPFAKPKFCPFPHSKPHQS
ncbi:homeobox-leucine zipper protein HAT14 [Neltuma alba]|uniref:homeobox-leucine zipper protein HAT14 n=1 Tax=Neltuma alba TaxID=207710 RepID=UPI0010A2A9B5|nr:homeobox-leucine zipper protein HAT14-like [Prosopis alba]